jgi:uncharacterized phage-like protein YoqJ
MICCVTGHRSKGFPFERSGSLYSIYLSRLQQTVSDLIDSGYSHFITGVAEGADIDFARTIIDFRLQNPSILLEAAMPYPILPSKRKTVLSEERDVIISACDMIHIVAPYYHRGCMQKRNQYMVDRADAVLAIWNGTESGGTWNTIRYALSVGRKLMYIRLDELNLE